MGGVMGKNKKKGEAKAPPPSQTANRKLSVVGDGLVAAAGDPNSTGTVTDVGACEWLRFNSLSNAGYEPDGHKKTNQDAFFSVSDFGDKDVSIFGVFDGHGACGHHVSALVKREIQKALDKAQLKSEGLKEPSQALEPLAKHLSATYNKVNTLLEKDKTIDSSLSGTTAVTCLVLGEEGKRSVVCANAGDSRAIVAFEDKGKLKVHELSVDQKPDRDIERQRILDSGGRVEPLIDDVGDPIGPFRVWLANMMLPGLAMARSIGDDIAATVGVHATPEVTQYQLTEKDRFMVLASDGVWEFLSNDDVVEIVRSCEGDAEKACVEVCGRAYREWKAEEEVVDDITCIVVFFEKV
mmetsp:Transcript_25231/g.63710  ORF Transcript_25231/g.63710 Transcript_25231/m.63710 type:complete len:352 (+) Transcript_25231:30-1085(+)